MIALLAFALSLSVVSPFAQTKIADFDGDGTVGFTDFLAFAEAFGSSQIAYDLDGSGTVDFGDFLIFVEAFAADNAPTVSSATYQVTFEATWSAATHPTDFPEDNLAYFSSLVGATHSADVTFWEADQLASPGIKNMAETGSSSPLTSEINAAVDGGTAGSLFQGLHLDTTPASTSITFDIDENNPLVTLVTMIAPSPDWFVGVHGTNLFESGDWIDELSIDLFPYDSGTDSGVTFTSEDQATEPPVDIRKISGPPFSSQKLGTFTFTKQ